MTIKPPKIIGRQHQAGFTIIEVLIAIVIFSIGFMAAAGLQIRSLRSVGGAQTDPVIHERCMGP